MRSLRASRSTDRLAWTLLLVPTLGLVNGCGPSGPPPASPDANMTRDLENFGEMYRLVSSGKGRPPKNLTELQESAAGMTGGLTQITSDNLVVYWGAELSGLGEEPGNPPSDKILAYEKHVPESGGYVLMLDRTVKKMTPEEFKSAPKAGTEPPAEAAKK